MQTHTAGHPAGRPALSILHELQPRPAPSAPEAQVSESPRESLSPNSRGRKFGANRTDARGALNPPLGVGEELSALPEFQPRPFTPRGKAQPPTHERSTTDADKQKDAYEMRAGPNYSVAIKCAGIAAYSPKPEPAGL